ncbi:MAG: ATP-binding protein [Longimicrobiales bacterium]
MTLHRLRGHEETREALARARGSGALPSALLLHGPRGVGKQRLALWIGQLVLCPRPEDGGPCGECKDCRLALRLEHPDLHWFFPLLHPGGGYSPDKLARTLEDARAEALEERRRKGVWSSHSEDVRGLYLATARTVRRMARRKPAMSERQVFIIAEAEELVPQESSPEAANALLKLLEEPPPGTFFILTSPRPGRLLPTIRSRTFPLHLPGLPEEEVVAYLREEAGADEAEARRVARLAQGSIGRAMDYLPPSDGEKGVLEQLRESSFHLLRVGLSPRAADGLTLASEYSASGARGLLDLFTHLEQWLRDLAAAAAGQDDRIINEDGRDYLVRIARDRKIHPVAVARAFEPVEEARLLASGNVNPQLIVAGLVQELRRTLLSSDALERAS